MSINCTHRLPRGTSSDRLSDELSPLSSGPAAIAALAEQTARARLSTLTHDELRRSDIAHAATRTLIGTSVGAIAQRHSVSERHLRNLFSRDVGIAPKRFARIDRVRTVLRHLRHERWSAFATNSSYYDQSHMAAEFRDVMGVSPSAFRDGDLPATRTC